MKARIIKHNSNKNLNDYISVGDRITDVGVVHDKNGKYVGVLFSTGHTTKTGIQIESNIIIPPEGFDDGEMCLMISDKLAYGKYILCSDEGIAEVISEIKRDLASVGINLGEIFLSRTSRSEKLEIERIVHY